MLYITEKGREVEARRWEDHSVLLHDKDVTLRLVGARGGITREELHQLFGDYNTGSLKHTLFDMMVDDLIAEGLMEEL